jgi:hypothetical protein
VCDWSRVAPSNTSNEPTTAPGAAALCARCSTIWSSMPIGARSMLPSSVVELAPIDASPSRSTMRTTPSSSCRTRSWMWSSLRPGNWSLRLMP